MDDLTFHPALERFNPARRTLVRLGSKIESASAFFAKANVTIRPGFLYGDTFNSKAPVAYELISALIRAEKIHKSTKIVAATSGNTGLGIAQLCKALGLYCELVMQNDTPSSKVGVITALGDPINTRQVTSSTVQYAREQGEQPGWCNVDQYSEQANPIAQMKYLAPQLFDENNGRIDLVVVAGGTLGTITGLQRYIEEHELKTKLVLALCENGHEIPGARDKVRVMRDVRFATPDTFEHQMTATRYQAFLASYAMFPEVEWTPGGPTSGLAYSVALRFLHQHALSETLEQFRGPDERINLVFLCPDDYRPYGDLYRSTLNEHRDFFSSNIPIERLLEAS
ncbi:MAG: pyridoxal-phosphate dependent enzyme [Candidatus Pacebacteria bacterium]|nr:pyridoxal-phosphate dependent enzyme [Candidatus Paceibacterota bacterium]